jgi:hypothetical protein
MYEKRWHGCVGKIGGGAVELCLSGVATRRASRWMIVYAEISCSSDCVKLNGNVSGARRHLVVCETGKYKVCSTRKFGRCR